MTEYSREYVLFRDGWDEESDRELEDALVAFARSPMFRERILPAFTEMLKREQFLKLMECLNPDRCLDFNRGYVEGIGVILNRLDAICAKADLLQ
jgi:hypothetical protein